MKNAVILHKLKRHAPTILTCLSAVGVVATVVLSVKATPKAIELIKERKAKTDDVNCEELTPIETVKTVWKCYIPACAVGVSTLICIFGVNMLTQKHQASLVSAYGLLDQTYKKYRASAKSVYGEDADKKIMAEMAKKTCINTPSLVSNSCTYYPDIDESDLCLFYDTHSDRLFRATMAAVINAEYHVNRNLQLRGYTPVNEFYEFLGIDIVEGGEEVGWYIDNVLEDGYLWLDFENEYIEMEDGMACYRIVPLTEPKLYEDI